MQAITRQSRLSYQILDEMQKSQQNNFNQTYGTKDQNVVTHIKAIFNQNVRDENLPAVKKALEYAESQVFSKMTLKNVKKGDAYHSKL